MSFEAWIIYLPSWLIHSNRQIYNSGFLGGLKPGFIFFDGGFFFWRGVSFREGVSLSRDTCKPSWRYQKSIFFPKTNCPGWVRIAIPLVRGRIGDGVILSGKMWMGMGEWG